MIPNLLPTQWASANICPTQTRLCVFRELHCRSDPISSISLKLESHKTMTNPIPLRRFLGVLVISVALVGCKPSGGAGGVIRDYPASGGGKKLTVGFAQVGAESAWRTAETESIKSEAEKRGVNLKFSDAQGKQENQIKAVRGFIAQGVDAIILAPVVETGWEPTLREARQAKIPVVLVDRGVKVEDESLFATLIASDFVAEGKMAGDWLAKKTDGKAQIIELQGTPGAAPAIDRKKGFEEAIKDKAEMKIIASQSGDFRRSGGKEVMEALLKVHPGVTAVYAHNDDMALGAIQALEEAGKKPGSDVVVVSIDAVKGAFEAMAAGKLNCTVECNPLLGPMAFDAVEKAVKGGELPKKTVVQDRVFDQSTAQAELPNRKY
jgi:simple sugar transport system substrate-binding protein